MPWLGPAFQGRYLTIKSVTTLGHPALVGNSLRNDTMAQGNKRILPDLASLQAQIDALTAQNEALKSGVKDTSITITDYQGKPTLYFQGNFRPFHMGMSKLKTVLNNVDVVEKFIKSNGKSI